MTPDMSLRKLKELRKEMKRDPLVNKFSLRQLEKWIQAKQNEHTSRANAQAANRIINFLKKAIPK